MISITDKHNCCGCEACRQRCPHDCIMMREDNEGFLYPEVDMAKCVDCGLCEKVCPIINVPSDVREPLHTYAAINPNEEIRMASSSGGIFSALAEHTIATGGVVFGARFDKDWNVEHGWADTLDGIKAFRGSKYVQSKIGNSYREAERFLKQGRNVLFSGTPCQIAGLKTFLRKDYPNLLTVDIICHGVPSPKVWRGYLKSITNSPLYVNFRDKTTDGWNNWHLKIIDKSNITVCQESLRSNTYISLFLKNYSLRPSCYDCRMHIGKSDSDIKIADYWGIKNCHPHFFDNKGSSLVIIYTSKGKTAFESLHCEYISTGLNKAIVDNPSYNKSVPCPKLRKYFFNNFDKKGCDIYYNIAKRSTPSKLRCFASRLKRLLLSYR